MNKQLCIRIQEAGFEVDLDPPRDGDCFYHAAAHQLGINCEAAKNRLFSFLESNRSDVSHDLILFSFAPLEFTDLKQIMKFVNWYRLGC